MATTTRPAPPNAPRRPIPELLDLPRAQQAQIWEQARLDAGSGPLPWLILISIPLVVLARILLDRMLIGASILGIPIPIGLAGLTSFLAPALVACVPLRVVFRRRRLRRVWQLAPHLCDRCGYNLTGNVHGRCPECGQSGAAHAAERIAGSDTNDPVVTPDEFA